MINAEINAVGILLSGLRLSDESCVIVNLATYAGDHETPDGSVSVTVASGKHTASGHAVGLADALAIARDKLKRDAEARRRAVEKLKGQGA